MPCVAPLSASPGPLARNYDVALLDLDGVLYVGRDAVPHAADALARAAGAGLRSAYVTNNASRTPDEVADHLREIGVPAQPKDVITSSMAVARLLRDRFATGAPVLVAGAGGLREEIRAAGFRLVDSADDRPVAVAQGWDPQLTYGRLAEASLAVSRGAAWIAANADATLPTLRGTLPGNGALVALIATATGRQPVVAGKPERALHEESIRRSGARRPLIVGDRLDTDIEGACRAGTPSLLVLTGVTDVPALLAAGPSRRPTFLAADLRGLLDAHPTVNDGACQGWTARVSAGAVVLSGDGDPLDALRACCAVAWAEQDRSGTVPGVDRSWPRWQYRSAG